MFRQVAKYSVQMTNILLKLFDLEIKNKHIIEEKDRSIQNLQKALKEQKFKAKLYDKNNENNQVLIELQVTKQKINNMEKQNKDLENIIIEKDFLQATLKEIDANYQNLKAKKDILSVEHNKLQRDYKNTKQTLLKQQKILEDLRVEVGNVYQVKNEIQRQADQKHAQMDKNLQMQMAFNEKLQNF